LVVGAGAGSLEHWPDGPIFNPFNIFSAIPCGVFLMNAAVSDTLLLNIENTDDLLVVEVTEAVSEIVGSFLTWLTKGDCAVAALFSFSNCISAGVCADLMEELYIEEALFCLRREARWPAWMAPTLPTIGILTQD